MDHTEWIAEVFLAESRCAPIVLLNIALQAATAIQPELASKLDPTCQTWLRLNLMQKTNILNNSNLKEIGNQNQLVLPLFLKPEKAHNKQYCYVSAISF